MSVKIEVYSYIQKTLHNIKYLPANKYILGAYVVADVYVTWDNGEYEDTTDTTGKIYIGSQGYSFHAPIWNQERKQSGSQYLYTSGKMFYGNSTTDYTLSAQTVYAQYSRAGNTKVYGEKIPTTYLKNTFRGPGYGNDQIPLGYIEDYPLNFYATNKLGATNIKWQFMTRKGTIIREGTFPDEVDSKGSTPPNTKYSFAPTEEELAKIYADGILTTDNYYNSYCILKITGVYNKKTYTSCVYYYVKASGKHPTVEITVNDTNDQTVALTGSADKLIRYLSKPHITTTWTAYNDATIAATSIKYNGTQIVQNVNELTIENYLSNYITFNATDSRGLKSSISKNLPTIYYDKPTMTVKGEISLGGTLKVTINGQVWQGNFGAVENSFKVKYRYKKSGESWKDWVESSPITLNDSYTATAEIALGEDFSYRIPYVIQGYIEDKAISFYSPEITVASTPIFDWSYKDFNFNVPVQIKGGYVQAVDILFDDIAGEADNITIDGYFSSYEYIEIFYSVTIQPGNGAGQAYNSVKIVAPIIYGVFIDLSSFGTNDGNNIYLNTAKYKVEQGNTLSKVFEKTIKLSSAPIVYDESNIVIHRILGYRRN